MTVVDDSSHAHRSAQPLHRDVELGEDLVVFEILSRDRGRRRRDLLAEISSRPPLIAYRRAFGDLRGAEELYLLAEPHG